MQTRIHKKNYLPFSLLTLIFVVPMVLSAILFYYHDSFHLKTSNYGTFIRPPIAAHYLYSATQKEKEKKWRIIYVSDDVCHESCQKINHALHQVQKALGKDSERVMTTLINGKEASLEKLKKSLEKNSQEKNNLIVKNKIYLMDPIGNLFMYYPSDVNPMYVLKDLKRVLEVSQIG